jgi:hypothetical protein
MKDDNKNKIALKSRESNYAEISKRRFLSRFNNNDNNNITDDNPHINKNIRNCTRNTNNTNYFKNVDLHSTIIKNIHLIIVYAILVINRSIS